MVNKLARIIFVILIGFALSSLVLYRLRLANTLRSSRQAAAAHSLVEETKTFEGEIQTVDPGAQPLTLLKEVEEVMLAFDERTWITESGKPIQPASIATGKTATVKYAQRGGKKMARKIELVPAEPPESTDAY